MAISPSLQARGLLDLRRMSKWSNGFEKPQQVLGEVLFVVKCVTSDRLSKGRRRRLHAMASPPLTHPIVSAGSLGMRKRWNALVEP